MTLVGTGVTIASPDVDVLPQDELFYPLSVTDLATSLGTNNLATFDSSTYLQTSGGDVYALPADAAVATGVNGQACCVLALCSMR